MNSLWRSTFDWTRSWGEAHHVQNDGTRWHQRWWLSDGGGLLPGCYDPRPEEPQARALPVSHLTNGLEHQFMMRMSLCRKVWAPTLSWLSLMKVQGRSVQVKREITEVLDRSCTGAPKKDVGDDFMSLLKAQIVQDVIRCEKKHRWHEEESKARNAKQAQGLTNSV